MRLHLPSRKSLLLTLTGLVLAWLLFAWLALPRILQSQAEKFINEKTGHRLSIDRPEFNPFELSLRLSGLHLAKPNGEPLLAFRELVLDMSSTSLLRRAFIFDSIRLDGLETTLVMLPNGQINWSALLASLKNKEETVKDQNEAPLPKLDIHHFALTDAKLDFSDKRVAPAFVTHVEPMNLELTELSTLPNDKGQYKFTAQTTWGARVEWQGDVNLEPTALTGKYSIDNVDIARLSTYFKSLQPVAPTAGIAGVSAEYRLAYAAGKLGLNLDHLEAKLRGLKLSGNSAGSPSLAVENMEAKEGSFDLIKNTFALNTLNLAGGKLDLLGGKTSAGKAFELGGLTLENLHVNLATHQATLGRIGLKNGQLRVSRNAHGQLDIMQALNSLSQSATKPVAAPASPPKKIPVKNALAPVKVGWHYRADKLDVSGFVVALRDESVAPAAELNVDDIALSAEGLSEDLQIAVPLRASCKFRSGGHFEAEGKVVPAAPTANFQIKLADLSLAPVQPYLSTVAKLKLVGGQLAGEGHASLDSKGFVYQGNFNLRDLRLNEADTGNLFLAWKTLGTRALEVSPLKLDIDELLLDGLDTKLIINKDKSVSVSGVLRQSQEAAATVPPANLASPPPTQAKLEPSFLLNIDRLRIAHSEMDFADLSLALPFATRIHHLHGVITSLTSKPGIPGQVELDGQVDEYGLAQALGQVDFFNPTDFMQMKVMFQNIEMTKLTPYSATFAGRRIASGKLTLNLEYNIKQRQLQGDNQVIMDQLTLGDKIDSPEAKDLPLDFAIALLQDSNGRIDLGLPVSGNMDDPKFSYGGIVWKALVNVLTKIVTAPFRALGALFGGGDKFDNITFEAGKDHLSPPEREKLLRLAGVLGKRPSLALEIHGGYSEADRNSLQDRQIRLSIAEKLGRQVEAGSDPGPISTHQPKIQATLEAMYAAQLGSDELASLKESFRQANPGQLAESTSGKVMSRLSGIFKKKKAQNEQEVSQLKGADFYETLYQRLRDKVVVDDKRLQALAMARGVATATALKADGVPAERMTVSAPEKAETEGHDIPVKLVLGAASKVAATTN